MLGASSMRILPLMTALLLASCQRRAGTLQHETEKFTLDFRSGHNLKLVYDAGVRPWREGPEEYNFFASNCGVGNPGLETGDQELNYWTILLPGGEKFSFATSFVEFQILEDYDIARIDFRGTVRNARDAANIAKNICAAMNIPIADSAESMVHSQIYGMPRNKHVESSGVGFSIAFWAGGAEGAERGSENITLHWKDYLPKDSSKAPLKKMMTDLRPPPGYEGVSMEPYWQTR